jgi:hypothetical protein
MSDALRSCSGCSAHLLTNNTTSEYVWCRKCEPKYVKPWHEWVAGIAKGSEVYLQPYVAWRGLSHSRYLVTARDDDMLTVQIIGIPKSSMTVHVFHVGQYDLTPRE